jgi:hypothetical protein
MHTGSRAEGVWRGVLRGWSERSADVALDSDESIDVIRHGAAEVIVREAWPTVVVREIRRCDRGDLPERRGQSQPDGTAAEYSSNGSIPGSAPS